MKIGLDLRPLQSHNEFRGIGRYISNLLSQLSIIDHKNHYKLYIYDELKNPLDNLKIPKNFKKKEHLQSHRKLVT